MYINNKAQWRKYNTRTCKRVVYYTSITFLCMHPHKLNIFSFLINGIRKLIRFVSDPNPLLTYLGKTFSPILKTTTDNEYTGVFRKIFQGKE
jgi:hypothetical protein